MNKRAQGLSLNTIIIAVIVLIVLIVLILLFTGYFGAKFTPVLTDCISAGGECKASECGNDIFERKISTIVLASCPEDRPICCKTGLGEGKTSPPEPDEPVTTATGGSTGITSGGDGSGSTGGGGGSGRGNLGEPCIETETSDATECMTLENCLLSDRGQLGGATCNQGLPALYCCFI